MRLRRFRTSAAVLAATALVLTACGGDDTGSEGTETTSESASPTGEMTSEPATGETTGEAMPGDVTTLTEGTLTVCSDIPYPPFEFEEDGAITGFDIDVMRAIADQMSLELEVNAIGFDPIQSGTALNSNQCDVAASAMTITEERKANLDFTDPYYDAKQSLLTADDSGISTIDDLSGASVGVQSATTGETYARENAPEDAEITAFENPGDLLTALQAGQVDAVLQDLPVNADYARGHEGFSIVEEYDTGEQYGFAVKKDREDGLLQALNGGLQAIRDGGTYDELYDQYFSAE